MNPSDEYAYKEEGTALPPRHRPDEPTELPMGSAAPERSTELIDVVVVGAPRFRVAAALVLLLSLGCGAAAVLNLAFVGAALACGVVALVLFLWGRRTVQLRFTANGIAIGNAGLHLIPYEEIVQVYVADHDRGRRHFPIHLLLQEGCETLPAKLSIPSEAVYEFLLGQPLGTRAIGTVPEIFHDFLRQQRALHSPAQIFTYRARVKVKSGLAQTPGAVVLGVGAMLGVLPMLGLAFLLNGLFLVAFIWLIFGLLTFALGFFLETPINQRVKNRQSSFLILTPAALALCLGDLKGELRWSELVDIVHKPNALSMTLRVKGADIAVPDIFCWPLNHIAAVCRAYHADSKRR